MAEVHEADLEFENTDAGASTTYPTEAGKVRKGGHLVIRGRPCKARPLIASMHSFPCYCCLLFEVATLRAALRLLRGILRTASSFVTCLVVLELLCVVNVTNAPAPNNIL